MFTMCLSPLWFPPPPCLVPFPVPVLLFKGRFRVAVQAAIERHLPAELASIDTFLGRFHVQSIQHVPPRMATTRPLLTRLLVSCLSREFSAVNQHGVWSFAWILMFARLVFRSPRAGRKKHYYALVTPLESMEIWCWNYAFVAGYLCRGDSSWGHCCF